MHYNYLWGKNLNRLKGTKINKKINGPTRFEGKFPCCPFPQLCSYLFMSRVFK